MDRDLDPAAVRISDAMSVLRLFAEADLHEQLYWRVDGMFAPVTFFVVLTDFFEAGESTLEEINRLNLVDLRQAFTDVREASGGDVTYAPALFAARNRHCRPYGGAYPSDVRLWPLFDAAGPLRPKDGPGRDRVANPLRPGVPGIPGASPPAVAPPASAKLPPAVRVADDGWPALPEVLPELKE